MSRKIGHTEAQYRKWIKEGRGTGEGNIESMTPTIIFTHAGKISVKKVETHQSLGSKVLINEE
ncbi:hypothetical protein ACSLBF_17080 [Pseudoalteromonas sp. T1lg65]|uniref:hypothetical protein n=1 Tax=Pseudoalteromonas sp. T1lg65 TaxID=2077101 RepID=UPI003F7B196A